MNSQLGLGIEEDTINKLHRSERSRNSSRGNITNNLLSGSMEFPNSDNNNNNNNNINQSSQC
ncbi:hypothetical protein DDB_G0288945 [Dictyostelium discoideum AX4]|uniref:Uncharacterized protein n=1 Tax=Dictyostelium discoideum TaxID=44689 RepID=Q54I74_DICDI|nr:hypothetical protein DDB_G0288945 [Dictyostelium discoideum AX4]EAL62996.1 hypothetical protein DDB_G0288945 [Dictyostelium discoideum AX4]|eukprot:XP_636505.1 hypothetical protein DDB_G0288945 [Dictyostelium discoideum AX4]